MISAHRRNRGPQNIASVAFKFWLTPTPKFNVLYTNAVSSLTCNQAVSIDFVITFSKAYLMVYIVLKDKGCCGKSHCCTEI